MSDEIAALKEKLRKKKIKPVLDPKNGLSTGSTLLNLACSGDSDWGFQKGFYYLLVGDTDSGKTWLTQTCFAEASINKEFKDYRFILDSGEFGTLMDRERFFGKEAARRTEPPRKSKSGEPLNSSTIQEFYYNIDDIVKDGRPFIYILDSHDVLGSEGAEKKFQTNKRIALKETTKALAKEEAEKDGEKAKGSYGDGKAKDNSANLRRLLAPLNRTGSILIIINQTRDNIGFGAYLKPKTHSGGWALEFYATLQMWTSKVKSLTKPYKGKYIQTGGITRIQVKRSRFTGKVRSVEVPLYHSSGIDDVGSCINYLTDWKHWKKTGKEDDPEVGKVDAPEFDFNGSREKLIQLIEEQNRESELRQIVKQVWQSVEEACSIQRKNRYS